MEETIELMRLVRCARVNYHHIFFITQIFILIFSPNIKKKRSVRSSPATIKQHRICDGHLARCRGKNEINIFFPPLVSVHSIQSPHTQFIRRRWMMEKNRRHKRRSEDGDYINWPISANCDKLFLQFTCVIKPINSDALSNSRIGDKSRTLDDGRTCTSLRR